MNCQLYRDFDNCPACGNRFTVNPKKKARGFVPSEHHIVPKRFLRENNTGTIKICRTCHDYLEKRIPQRKKQTQRRYLDILNIFLKDRAKQFRKQNQVYVFYNEDTECYTLLTTGIDVDMRKIAAEDIRIENEEPKNCRRTKKKFQKYTGTCRACEKPYTNKMVRRKTVHHVFPSQFIKGLPRLAYQEIIHVCAACHSELEGKIHFEKPQTKEAMLACLNAFLSERGAPEYIPTC